MRTATEEAWDRIFLLSLFAGSNEPLDNLKIQKLTFISEDEARKEGLLAAHYPFYRNQFGPFSPDLANDVHKLEECGFIYSETRQPTNRGKYLLQYVSDDVSESKSAVRSLQIVAETQEKYQSKSSFALKDLVYEMAVSVSGMGGEVMKVKDIPMKASILKPSWEKAKEQAAISGDVLEDVMIELSLTKEDLDPDNPANVQVAREALRAALA